MNERARLDRTPALPPDLVRIVDEVCDSFEADWQAGTRPHIEEYLGRAPASARAELLRELLAVELEYRWRAGEQPSAEEYRGHFPRHAGLIAEVFEEGAPPPPRLPPFPLPGWLLRDLEGQVGAPPAPAPGPDGPAGVSTVELVPPAPRSSGSLDELPPPGLLGDYELLEETGRGGMGVVYKARQRSLDRIVALKLILPDRLAGLPPEERQKRLERFWREAQTAARSEHAHVVPVYEVGEIEGRPFYSMLHVEGRSLAALIHEHPLPGQKAAELLEPVARAAHHVHTLGIIHRDFTPRNILVGALDRPFITDFGLAKWLRGDWQVTQTGMWMGVPSYLSPEQAQDAARVTPASDVYSLGAVLYAMLTGRPPFQAATPQETLRQVRDDEPIAPRRLNPAVDRDLETIALKCLEKEPQRRYATAAELADDLDRYLRKVPIKARPLGRIERLVRWARRKPALATVSGLLAAAALLLAATTVGLVVQQRADLLKASQNAARTSRDLGLSYCDKGDVPPGLLHLARGLVLAPPGDEDLQRTIRTNLACWARQSALLAAPPIRCEAAIDALALSPDGERVLLGGTDGVARVLELATGQELFRLRGHTGRVRAVAWSPTGTDLFTGSRDGTVRIWNAVDGALRGQVQAGGQVHAVACGPGGQTFAAGGSDRRAGRARLWNTATRQQLQVFEGPPGSANALAIHPDGTKLLTGGGDGTVRLWDTASGQELLVRKGPRGVEEAVRAVAFTPDGRSFVTGGMDHSVRCWDATTGEPGEPIRTAGRVDAVAVSPDGLLLLTGGSSRSVQLWDVATGHPLGLPLVHRGDVKAIAFGPEGKTLVTADADRTIRLWQMPTRADLGPYLPHEGWVSALAFSPDSTLLATGSGWNDRDDQLGGEARLWELPAATRRPHGFRDGYGIRALAFSPDGLTLATGHSDRIARLWDVRTGTPCGPNLKHDGWLEALAFSPDGQSLVTGCLKSAAKPETVAYLWDVRNGQPLHRWPHTASVNAATFHPGGQLVLTASRDGSARLWDTTTGNPAGEFPHAAAINAAAFNHDGSQVVTAGDDGTARLWDTTTQQLLHKLPHPGAVRAAIFSPDGAFVLTGGADRTARVWDARTGLPVGQPLSHEDRVEAVAFSPDGATVLTGSLDNTARFWDRATGTPLGPVLRHVWSRKQQEQEEAEAVPGSLPRRPQKGVRAVAFSPDGKWAATASYDFTARLWPTPGRLGGDAARISLWAQTATGLELDAHDVPRELPASTWHSRRVRLAQLGGPSLP